jgi:hypothetical protein
MGYLVPLIFTHQLELELQKGRRGTFIRRRRQVKKS